MAIDSHGNLFVIDNGNHVVRKVNAAGYVTTIAGNPWESGDQDGPALSARFTSIYWIALDSAGNLFFTGDNNLYVFLILVTSSYENTVYYYVFLLGFGTVLYMKKKRWRGYAFS